MELLTVALFLATLNSKIIDWIKAPVLRRYPTADLWWIIYVALATGIGLTWLAGVNVFGQWIANEAAGITLTGILVGGGSSLIYDVFTDRGQGQAMGEDDTAPH